MAIAIRKANHILIVAAVGASLGLAGCETTGRGATTGAAVGGLGGCAIGAAASRSNPLAGCLIGGLIGGLAGAMIGDAIEKAQQERAVYAAMRSGRVASSGTFHNSQKQRVSYTVKPTKTYKSWSDQGLTCRDYTYNKTINGQSAGSSSGSQCQVRVAGKPTWQAPEG